MSDEPYQSDTQQHATLRDRIAAVIEKNHPGKYGNSLCLLTADAVIADLGLRRASKPNDYDHVRYPPGDRYITDWIATREPRSADKLGLTGDGQ